MPEPTLPRLGPPCKGLGLSIPLNWDEKEGAFADVSKKHYFFFDDYTKEILIGNPDKKYYLLGRAENGGLVAQEFDIHSQLGIWYTQGA